MTAEFTHRKNMLLKELCNRIVMDHPQAAGLAMIELDCGCRLACGVSFTGAPIGRLQHVESEIGMAGNEPRRPVCLTCRREPSKIQERIVLRKLIWPGEDFEKPDPELRQFIGQQVFGTDYEEADP